jgi:uncharacterized membrane protein
MRLHRALLTAVVIFLLTYLVLAIGRLPGFRVDRTGARHHRRDPDDRD